MSKKPLILIVEDDELVATQIKHYLSKCNFEVCGICKSGVEAIDLVRLTKPDIILMDIYLDGDLDGIETTKQIKSIDNIPVLYLTNYSDNEIIERAKITHPYAYLHKSIPEDELKLQIEFAYYRHTTEIEKQNIFDNLLKSQKQLDAIINKSRDAIFFIDRECIITYWNDSAEKIFQFTKDEAVGKNLNDLIISEQNNRDFFNAWKAVKGKDTGELLNEILEIYSKRRNRSLVPIELKLTPITIDNEWYACGFARDVTERISAEDELMRLIEEIQVSKDTIEQHANDLVYLNNKLAESEEQLKELNAAKDKFFSIIAHDLKGPFSGLLGYSQILSSNIETLSPIEIAEYASNIHESTTHLFKLLENLLQWSRLQHGHIENNPESFQLYSIVNINIAIIQARALQKRITLQNNIPGDAFVYADVNIVNTVFRNLLSNAVKFTNEGGLISVEINNIDDMFIEVLVSDNGVGMSSSTLDKIFRIDIHHTERGTNDEQGTGLGLILCKDLIEKSKGKIWVESSPGKGTTFHFTVPKGIADIDYNE